MKARLQVIGSLPKEAQKVMRANLCLLKLVIIDEVSMLSNLNLAYIHLRLSRGNIWRFS